MQHRGRSRGNGATSPQYGRMLMTRFVALAAAGLLAACASVPTDPIARTAYEEANDPLEPVNRAVFAFNIKLDEYALEPIARAYRKALNETARDGVRNFLHNLRAPITFANDLLQGEFDRAAQTSWDFVMNTTVGFLGFADVTGGWEPHDEDLGQTLAVWGVGEGPYLVLPFFGPSNVRDTAGVLGDRYLDPTTYHLDSAKGTEVLAGRTVTDAVDTRARTLEEFNEIKRTSFDFYVTARSLYRQARRNQIRNGAPAPLDDVTFN